jgi:hypothetical protein
LSKGKLFSEIISDISLTTTVDSTVDVRINASPAVDTIAGKMLLLRTSIANK